MRVKLSDAMTAYENKHNIRPRMTQTMLAEIAGLSRPTISDLLHGNWAGVRLSTIEKICRALDCQVEDILMMIEVGDDEGGDDIE